MVLLSSIRIPNCYNANAILNFTTCFTVSEMFEVLRGTETVFLFMHSNIRREKSFFKKIHLKRQEKISHINKK